jgi:hypothetical protein
LKIGGVLLKKMEEDLDTTWVIQHHLVGGLLQEGEDGMRAMFSLGCAIPMLGPSLLPICEISRTPYLVNKKIMDINAVARILANQDRHNGEFLSLGVGESKKVWPNLLENGLGGAFFCGVITKNPTNISHGNYSFLIDIFGDLVNSFTLKTIGVDIHTFCTSFELRIGGVEFVNYTWGMNLHMAYQKNLFPKKSNSLKSCVMAVPIIMPGIFPLPLIAMRWHNVEIIFRGVQTQDFCLDIEYIYLSPKTHKYLDGTRAVYSERVSRPPPTSTITQVFDQCLSITTTVTPQTVVNFITLPPGIHFCTGFTIKLHLPKYVSKSIIPVTEALIFLGDFPAFHFDGTDMIEYNWLCAGLTPPEDFKTLLLPFRCKGMMSAERAETCLIYCLPDVRINIWYHELLHGTTFSVTVSAFMLNIYQVNQGMCGCKYIS